MDRWRRRRVAATAPLEYPFASPRGGATIRLRTIHVAPGGGAATRPRNVRASPRGGAATRPRRAEGRSRAPIPDDFCGVGAAAASSRRPERSVFRSGASRDGDLFGFQRPRARVRDAAVAAEPKERRRLEALGVRRVAAHLGATEVPRSSIDVAAEASPRPVQSTSRPWRRRDPCNRRRGRGVAATFSAQRTHAVVRENEPELLLDVCGVGVGRHGFGLGIAQRAATVRLRPRGCPPGTAC